MAEEEKKGLFGHKVFFLYPSYSFQTDILQRLRTMEYEVYTIQDYRLVRNILFKNRNSILYVNMDLIFNTATWVNFLYMLQEQDSLASNKFGIITEKADTNTIKNIELQVKHEAGIIRLENDTEENVRNIVKQLDSMDAKGRRQYVRANCLDDKIAEVFWLTNNTMFKRKIIDISAAGLAVIIPEKQKNSFKPGQLLQNINLMIKGKPMPIDAKIYAIKPGQNYLIGILMIEYTTDKNAMNLIREYVAETLDKKIQASIYGMDLDRNVYTVSEKKFKASENQKKAEEPPKITESEAELKKMFES
jgi:hypothetical protein